jgi:putative ABC transport system permease protein
LLCGPIFHAIRWTLLQISPDLLPPTILNLEPRIALWSVLLSVGISLFVGLLFGLYPARRAAGMNPIEALRHE